MVAWLHVPWLAESLSWQAPMLAAFSSGSLCKQRRPRPCFRRQPAAPAGRRPAAGVSAVGSWVIGRGRVTARLSRDHLHTARSYHVCRNRHQAPWPAPQACAQLPWGWHSASPCWQSVGLSPQHALVAMPRSLWWLPPLLAVLWATRPEGSESGSQSSTWISRPFRDLSAQWGACCAASRTSGAESAAALCGPLRRAVPRCCVREPWRPTTAMAASRCSAPPTLRSRPRCSWPSRAGCCWALLTAAWRSFAEAMLAGSAARALPALAARRLP
mmetsp:Transcript_57401/g.170819  ORF Transcript_57401/g.170819 Transcript_57401/m.170819 type:complete len:272 (+) Transcript_57401:482-1297(+)